MKELKSFIFEAKKYKGKGDFKITINELKTIMQIKKICTKTDYTYYGNYLDNVEAGPLFTLGKKMGMSIPNVNVLAMGNAGFNFMGEAGVFYGKKDGKWQVYKDTRYFHGIEVRDFLYDMVMKCINIDISNPAKLYITNNEIAFDTGYIYYSNYYYTAADYLEFIFPNCTRKHDYNPNSGKTYDMFIIPKSKKKLIKDWINLFNIDDKVSVTEEGSSLKVNIDFKRIHKRL